MKVIQGKAKEIGPESAPMYAEFEAWYLKGNGQSFDLFRIDENILAPFGEGALLTQRISSGVCRARDRFVVSRIEQAINNFDSTLVIYGGSHWSTQRLCIERGLGAATFAK